MMARYAKTDFAIDLEAARGGQKAEVGWFQWVRGWQGYLAVVESVFEGGGGWRAAYGEVPAEEVGF